MNNKTESYDLPPGSVRNIVNADVTNSGSLRKRNGITKVYSGLNISNSFSCPIGSFFVEGTDLKLFDGTVSTVEPSVIFGESVAYEYFNKTCYLSDGLITRKIKEDGTISKWGIVPPPAPIIYETSGNLPGGTYHAALTYVDGDGVESGASPYAKTVIRDGHGVRFMNIPFPTDPQVVAVRLYLSMPDGSTLFYLGELAPGVDTDTVSSGPYDNSRVLESNVMINPPAGSIIKYYRGRLYIVSGKIVWYTSEFAYDWVNPVTGYMEFPKNITLMQPVIDGIYFADSDSTSFYMGVSPDVFEASNVFDYGAIAGQSLKIPNSNNVLWMSTRGPVVGGASGQIQNIVEKNIAMESADSATMLIKENNGIRQVITSLTNPVSSSLVCGSFATAEVIRKGA